MPIHPLIVHFPIALLIASAIFAVLSIMVSSKKELFQDVSFWNLLIGTIAALFAVLSGLAQEDTLVQNHEIHEIMELHEKLGFVCLGLFTLMVIWNIIRKRNMNNSEWKLYTLILVLSCTLLGYSGTLGGKMVFEEGAGVKPMEKIIEQEGFEHDH